MTELQRTALYDAHKRSNARIIDFSGWEMPVQYTSIIEEHKAVRADAGMFDTSHMGQLHVAGEKAAEWLDSLLPNDIATLQPGQARYSPLCAEDGTIIDDLMVYRLDDEEFLVVVNASGREKDRDWLLDHLTDGVALTPLYDGRAMIAVQGPKAVGRIADAGVIDALSVPRFGIQPMNVFGAEALVARTGYTGEDGVEIFLDAEDAEMVWDSLLSAGVVPAGLGARDTLRLEAGLPLYGNDIDRSTTPLEAGLGWTVKLDKPEFIGRASLARQKQAGIRKKLVGFEVTGKGIARHGHRIEIDGKLVGEVTSGTFSPSLGKAIGLAYLPVPASIGTECTIRVRDSLVPAVVVRKPFITR